MKSAIKNKVVNFFKSIYLKLFKINDTPHKIAAGFGLGVFLGILPGAGPLASLVLAAFLRINRAAALFGSLLTNTWLSFLIIPLSIKFGSAIMSLSWQKVYADWQVFLRDFHWINLLKLSVWEIILPVLAGYLVLGFFFGVAAYFITLITIKTGRKHAG